MFYSSILAKLAEMEERRIMEGGVSQVRVVPL
jgi:hypothetical protein